MMAPLFRAGFRFISTWTSLVCDMRAFDVYWACYMCLLPLSALLLPRFTLHRCFGRPLALLHPELQILPASHHVVLVWVSLTHAPWHSLQPHIMIEAKKEWTTIPLLTLPSSFPISLVDHSMYRALKIPIRHPHQTVRDVHHDTTRHWVCLDPVAGLAQDF